MKYKAAPFLHILCILILCKLPWVTEAGLDKDLQELILISAEIRF